MTDAKRYAISSFVENSHYWGFHWPAEGMVALEDVVRGMPKKEHCKVHPVPVRQPGHLHWQSCAKWVVIAIDEARYIEMNGFVNFAEGEVIHYGSPKTGCEFIRSLGLPVPQSFQCQVGADWSDVLIEGDGIGVTGQNGKVKVGDYGIAVVSGDGETEAGYEGKAIGGASRAGEGGIAISSYDASAGDRGIAIVDDEFGMARAGVMGFALNDTGGHSIVGDGGIALSCDDGTVQAGEDGILMIRDYAEGKVYVARVGENSIKPNVPYQIDDEGYFFEVKEKL